MIWYLNTCVNFNCGFCTFVNCWISYCCVLLPKSKFYCSLAFASCMLQDLISQINLGLLHPLVTARAALTVTIHSFEGSCSVVLFPMLYTRNSFHTSDSSASLAPSFVFKGSSQNRFSSACLQSRWVLCKNTAVDVDRPFVSFLSREDAVICSILQRIMISKTSCAILCTPLLLVPKQTFMLRPNFDHNVTFITFH